MTTDFDMSVGRRKRSSINYNKYQYADTDTYQRQHATKARAQRIKFSINKVNHPSLDTLLKKIEIPIFSDYVFSLK